MRTLKYSWKTTLDSQESCGKSKQSAEIRVNLFFLLWSSGEGGVDVDESDDDEGNQSS
jgi:hypothetical protein